MSVVLPINNCGECPHKAEKRYYTADSWEHVYQWFCTKTDRPKPEHSSHPNVTAVENSSRIGWEEDGRTPARIPTWCPLRTENENV